MFFLLLPLLSQLTLFKFYKFNLVSSVWLFHLNTYISEKSSYFKMLICNENEMQELIPLASRCALSLSTGSTTSTTPLLKTHPSTHNRYHLKFEWIMLQGPLQLWLQPKRGGRMPYIACIDTFEIQDERITN
ncbi:hypothetical protein O6H91_20G017100 [Diphasiastrum complanatum]|uniref:Uncharacterized protein n=1 Tax=Diphasiastrum complanatum TaxID=34168 RepID=A0ACC2APT3_DIPCM|nr:hypothetical protein O6H91_20G017100 [Diphasiastrum complanatum]